LVKNPAPGRPHGRSGVLALAALVAALATLPACEPVEQTESIALDSASIDIDGTVHDVRLSGAGATDSIAPATIRAAPGDAVRFTVADGRPHALAFIADSLDAPVRAFLESTGQLRGPPLVNQDASWVILLQGAPPGRYPFYCRSLDAFGIVTVVVEE
jgi:plastocyanin